MAMNHSIILSSSGVEGGPCAVGEWVGSLATLPSNSCGRMAPCLRGGSRPAYLCRHEILQKLLLHGARCEGGGGGRAPYVLAATHLQARMVEGSGEAPASRTP